MKMIKTLCVAVAIAAGTMSSFAQFTTGGKSSTKLNSGTEYGLTSGYKGMVELGYGIGVGTYGTGRVEFQTAHGYQFNPYLFTGVGVGVSYFHESSNVGLPIFADIRGSLPISNSKISPFVDFKVGYTVIDCKGVYFSPSVRVRLAIGKRTGINLSLGYELQNIKVGYDDFDDDYDYGYPYYVRSRSGYDYDYDYDDYDISDTFNNGAFVIKIGFDF